MTQDLETVGATEAEDASAGERVRSAAQLRMLHSLSARLNRLNDIREIGEAITGELRTLVDYHNSRVHLLDDDDVTLVPIAFRGELTEYQGETFDALLLRLGQGITGNAAARKQTLYAPDADKCEFAVTIPGTPDIPESVVTVPMLYGDRLVGTISLSKLGVGQFDDEDIRVLEVLASHAATAFENARLLEAEREAATTSRELLRLSQALTRVRDADLILDRTLQAIPSVLAVGPVWAYMRDLRSGNFPLVRERRADGTVGAPARPREVSAATAARLLLSRDEPFLLDRDANAAERPAPEVLGDRRHVLVAPIRFEPDGFGALVIAPVGREDRFSERQIPVLRGLADITSLALGNADRIDKLERFHNLVEGLNAVFWEADPATLQFTFLSSRAAELLGSELVGWAVEPRFWGEHIDPLDRAEALTACRAVSERDTDHGLEYRTLSAAGPARWFRDVVRLVPPDGDRPAQLRGMMVDITDRKLAEQQVAFLAYHDKLTGLPNRAMFEEHLEMAIARARRTDTSVAVVYLDLDNFKLVNDSLGHHAGDDLLRHVARRLHVSLRDSDLLARQGGDEFLVLLTDLPGEGSPISPSASDIAVAVVARIKQGLATPFTVRGSEFFVAASVGVSLFPGDARDAAALLRQADSAMYESKRGSGHALDGPEGVDLLRDLSFETRLRKAVDRKEWVLHYQPILDLRGGELVGMEALVRWREPRGGLVQPGGFIPLAEEMGLVDSIGDWVLEELARQSREWRDAGFPVDISFNLSPRQLRAHDVAERIIRRLHEAGVPPTSLTAEVTESSVMMDADEALRILGRLHDEGIRLAIDDFGVGYSSLRRVNHMPIDVLKVDRYFVRDAPAAQSAAGMVQAIIRLASALGVDVIAEGIETPAQREFLLANGCRVGQGFLFDRPLPPAEVWERYGPVAAPQVPAGGREAEIRGSLLSQKAPD